MPPSAPIWRQAFDKVERGVGLPLEALVRSERFFDAVSLGTRSRSAVRAELERASRRMLHLINIPTATDVRRLSDQISRMDRRVLAVSKALEDDRDGE